MKNINNPLMKISGKLLLLAGALFVFCYVYSGGSADENGPGAVWWLFLFFGVPALLAGLGLLFLGVITELNKSKSIKINGVNYGWGSIVVLVLLLALATFVLFG